MKKLMFSAAVAAVASGAFAVYTPEVYEMSMTVKTTACKAGQSKNVCDEDYDTYRVKATQTIKGLFWGCDCPTIADPVPFTTFSVYGNENECHGYVFWNAKDKTPFGTADFTWEFLQCINPKMTEVEGTWDLSLTNEAGDEVVNIRGGGIGSAKFSTEYMASYISKMDGNLAGWAIPGSLSYGCAACGGVSYGCAAWEFCTFCDEVSEDAPSTAYGSWSLKINTSVGKKYAQKSILDSYKFPAAVAEYLIKVDAGTQPSDCDAVKAAKQAYDLAVAESVKVSDAELEKAESIAWGAQYVAETNLDAVAEAFNTASNNWAAAAELADRTYAMQTQVGADVLTAKGAAAFRERTKEVVGMSWDLGNTLITYAGGSQEINRFTKLPTSPISPADLDALNAKLDDIVKAVADTKAAMDDAGHQLATAKQGKFVADEAAKTAEANWANRAALQAAAKIAVDDAQVKYQALANQYPECL